MTISLTSIMSLPCVMTEDPSSAHDNLPGTPRLLLLPSVHPVGGTLAASGAALRRQMPWSAVGSVCATSASPRRCWLPLPNPARRLSQKPRAGRPDRRLAAITPSHLPLHRPPAGPSPSSASGILPRQLPECLRASAVPQRTGRGLHRCKPFLQSMLSHEEHWAEDGSRWHSVACTHQFTCHYSQVLTSAGAMLRGWAGKTPEPRRSEHGHTAKSGGAHLQRPGRRLRGGHGPAEASGRRAGSHQRRPHRQDPV